MRKMTVRRRARHRLEPEATQRSDRVGTDRRAVRESRGLGAPRRRALPPTHSSAVCFLGGDEAERCRCVPRNRFTCIRPPAGSAVSARPVRGRSWRRIDVDPQRSASRQGFRPRRPRRSRRELRYPSVAQSPSAQSVAPLHPGLSRITSGRSAHRSSVPQPRRFPVGRLWNRAPPSCSRVGGKTPCP